MTKKKYSNDNDNIGANEPSILYGYSRQSSLDLISELLGGKKTLGKRVDNILEFLNLTQRGLSITVLKALQQRMKFTNKDMGSALEISESTLQRRLKKGEKLDKRESESTFQLATLWAKGLEVFDNEDDFRTWLQTKNMALGSNKPITLLHSPIGRDEIKDLLSRIEWGIYS